MTVLLEMIGYYANVTPRPELPRSINPGVPVFRPRLSCKSDFSRGILDHRPACVRACARWITEVSRKLGGFANPTPVRFSKAPRFSPRSNSGELWSVTSDWNKKREFVSSCQERIHIVFYIDNILHKLGPVFVVPSYVKTVLSNVLSCGSMIGLWGLKTILIRYI